MIAGHNLHYLRRLFNLQIKEMAGIMNKSDGNYSKIERNVIGMSLDNAKKICDFFELKIDELISKEENSLAITINEKGKDYMISVFEKIKKQKSTRAQNTN